MIKYQIHKACKSIFVNGALHDNEKCPICDVLITDVNKEVKIKNEDKLNKSDKARINKTSKILNKKNKLAEKQKKIDERLKKKAERDEKKRLREERKTMREHKSSIEVLTEKFNMGNNWFVDYWVYKNLPENLIVHKDYDGKYIIFQKGPNVNDYEAGYFIRLKNHEVEFYDEDLRVHTVLAKSVRKYIKGQDRLGKIHTIEKYLNRSTKSTASVKSNDE